MKRVNLFLLTTLLAACSVSEARMAAPVQRAQVAGQGNGLQIDLPQVEGSLRFAVVGDTGTGKDDQFEVAQRMFDSYQKYKFDFVLLQGDNLYGGENYKKKFEEPYQALLDAGVQFYATLGNHDSPDQRAYKPFNMGGERYYTFKKGPVRFFSLDSTYMSPEQLVWLEKELAGSKEGWKIAFFHHPLYSSGGRHGSDVELRKVLEPLFYKHGVDVVFSGHEHFYLRTKPQNGITYFISGAGGKLRRGDVEPSQINAQFFDQDNSFMLIEIADDTMYFQCISRTGKTVDKGQLVRRETGAPGLPAAQAEREAAPAQ